MSTLPSPDTTHLPPRATHCATCRAPLAWTAAQRAQPDHRPVCYLDEDDRTFVLCDRCAREAGLSDANAA